MTVLEHQLVISGDAQAQPRHKGYRVLAFKTDQPALRVEAAIEDPAFKRHPITEQMIGGVAINFMRLLFAFTADVEKELRLFRIRAAEMPEAILAADLEGRRRKVIRVDP